jgi:hypothetical protein
MKVIGDCCEIPMVDMICTLDSGGVMALHL